MSILKKIDGIKKGWKRHTTSAIFIALTTTLTTKGIDLSLYVESVETVYASVGVAYAAIMTTLKAIGDKVKQ